MVYIIMGETALICLLVCISLPTTVGSLLVTAVKPDDGKPPRLHPSPHFFKCDFHESLTTNALETQLPDILAGSSEFHPPYLPLPQTTIYYPLLSDSK